MLEDMQTEGGPNGCGSCGNLRTRTDCRWKDTRETDGCLDWECPRDGAEQRRGCTASAEASQVV